MNVLNLQKGTVLDLTKKDPSLNNILVGAGWDIAKKPSTGGFFAKLLTPAGDDFDLDLFALKLDSNGKVLPDGIVYYGKQKHTGIFLHEDNRTGAGDGDDEKISLDLSAIPSNCVKIVFGVVIYQAATRKQSFAGVENAYVRLVDESKHNAEICRFNLSEEGGANTAIIMADLAHQTSGWSFTAIGKYVTGDLAAVTRLYQ